MTDVADRHVLADELLRYAATAQRLLDASLLRGPYEAVELLRWRAIYADHAVQVVEDRDTYLADPAGTAVENLRVWCEFARRVLARAPRPAGSSDGIPDQRDKR